MAGAYSQDLRDRVINAVVVEGMSRRAAAARFGVSESSAIKWVERFERSGSRTAAKMGGYKRVRLEPHGAFLEGVFGGDFDDARQDKGHHAYVFRKATPGGFKSGGDAGLLILGALSKGVVPAEMAIHAGHVVMKRDAVAVDRDRLRLVALVSALRAGLHGRRCRGSSERRHAQHRDPDVDP